MKHRPCRSTSSWVRAEITASCSDAVSPSALVTDEAHVAAPLQSGDPDHVELVEVRGEDRQELRPFQQRLVRVLGQRQHPCVEVQPAQLAVGEPVGGQIVDRPWGDVARTTGGVGVGRRSRDNDVERLHDGRGDVREKSVFHRALVAAKADALPAGTAVRILGPHGSDVVLLVVRGEQVGGAQCWIGGSHNRHCGGLPCPRVKPGAACGGRAGMPFRQRRRPKPYRRRGATRIGARDRPPGVDVGDLGVADGARSVLLVPGRRPCRRAIGLSWRVAAHGGVITAGQSAGPIADA